MDFTKTNKKKNNESFTFLNKDPINRYNHCKSIILTIVLPKLGDFSLIGYLDKRLEIASL